MMTHNSPSRAAGPARYVPATLLAVVGAYILATRSPLTGAGWLLLAVAVAALPLRARRGAALVMYAALAGAVGVLAVAVASQV